MRKGTTLLETLIYIGILAVVVGAIIGILYAILNIQSRGTGSRVVSEEGRFVLQRIQREVRDSSLIDISTTAPASKLVLRMKDATRDYVAFYASGTAIWMDEGMSTSTSPLTGPYTIATTTSRLTSENVTIDPGSLSFRRLHNPPAKDAVQVDFTLSYNSNNPKLSFSRPFGTTIARVSAAVFDSDIIPAQDNAFSVGLGSLSRWKDGNFSNQVLVGGNLGVGGANTFSGSDRLVVGTYDLTSEGGQIKLSGTTTGKYWYIDNYNESLRFINSTSTPSPIDNVRMTVTKDGNVGIGTTVPAGILHVSSNVATDIYFAKHISDSSGAATVFRKSRGTAASPLIVTSGDDVGFILFEAYDGAVYQEVAGIKADVDATPGAGDMPGRLEFYTTQDNTIGRRERMRIDSAGNIGIGTTNPSARLQVSGVESNTSGIVSSLIGTAAAGAFQHFTNNTTGNWAIGHQPTTDAFAFIYGREPGTAGSEKVTILSSGNVGIGMADPSEKLYVTGNIYATGNINCGGSCGGSSIPQITAHVEKSADQSISSNTWMALTWNVESEDFGNLHDNVTNNSRFTIGTAGLYLVCANVSFASDGTNVRQMRFYKNNTLIATTTVTNKGFAGVANVLNECSRVRLAVNDYIEIWAFQNSGGALNVRFDESVYNITYLAGQ